MECAAEQKGLIATCGTSTCCRHVPYAMHRGTYTVEILDGGGAHHVQNRGGRDPPPPALCERKNILLETLNSVIYQLDVLN